MAAPPIAERHKHHFHRQSPIKESVRVATTANITIATALNNGDSLDGITLATDDRVLVKNQSTGSQNGIYIVGVTPVRAYDVSTDDPAFGFLVYVRDGSANAGTLWKNTNVSVPTIGTTALTFAQATARWFDVTTYGATGDGTTDDTTAVNLAIAALNTATRGVLYFPAGTYKTTGALTTITASGMALGDGSASYDNAVWGSEITCTSQTAVVFAASSKAFRFEKLAFVNTYAGTPTAGCAVLCDSAYLEQRVDFDSCMFQGFYDNVDVKVGAQWSMRGCFNIAPVRYGIRIRNTVNNDAGDWAISDSNFSAQTYNATSAIRMESSGGGKVSNVKINMALDSKHFTTGIDVAIGSGTVTVDLQVTNVSIENVTGDAISIATAGTGQFAFVTIVGCQVGLYSNNTGRAVKVSANATGGLGTNGGISEVIIDGCVFYTSGTARAAVELVKTNNVVLGDFAISGFTSRYTSTSDTNTTDNVAAPSFATPAIVLGTAAAAGAAATVIRSDSTVVAFDATAPVTEAFGDAAATGSAAVAARRDHVHGMPAAPASSDHEHVQNIVFSGDGATTVWELPAAPVDATGISVYVTGSRSIAWVLSGTLLTTLTFDAAPANASNNIVIDIEAAV